MKILLDRSVAAVAAADRIREVEVLDHPLNFPTVPLSNLPAKDHREFRRLTDGPIGVEQALAERVKGCDGGS
jgi:hypothetical protein